MVIGLYGRDGYGSSPYGSVLPSFGAVDAIALNPTHVELIFSTPLDFTYPPTLQASNYSISPSVTVISVTIDGSNSVILTTSPQSNILYTITVTTARSSTGAILNPVLNTVNFTGFPLVPGYFAIATSSERVRVIFSQPMLNDANLTNPTNYTITDLNLNAITVLSATPEQASNPVSVILRLGSAMKEANFYLSTLSEHVKTVTGLSILPPTSVFQFLQSSGQCNIPLRLFTGEVEGDLFGNPAGLVYFSPALNTSVPNSIIQVEDIDVCSTAFDSYHFPIAVDPLVLFTFGAGLVPTPSPDPYLLNQCVLWAPFPRNFEAQLNLTFTGATNKDAVPPPVDTACSALLKQQFALGDVALLNDTAWFLFNNTGTTVPPVFITAKNLTPIPSGPTTILVLHQQITGGSSFGPAPATITAKPTTSIAGHSQLFAGAGPPPVVLAQASMTAGASFSANLGARFRSLSTIGGNSYIIAHPTEGGPQTTPLNGIAFLLANAVVRRAVQASLTASAHVTPVAGVRRAGNAALTPSASVNAQARVHYHAQAALSASSAVSATATVPHRVQAIITSGTTVSATAS